MKAKPSTKKQVRKKPLMKIIGTAPTMTASERDMARRSAGNDLYDVFMRIKHILEI